jgi:hypothetical protein
LFRSTPESQPSNTGQAIRAQNQTQQHVQRAHAQEVYEQVQQEQAQQTQAQTQAQAQQAQTQASFTQFHAGERQYLTIMPWAREHYSTPAFLIPISCGPYFEFFFSSLPLDNANYFLDLFGPHRLPDSYTSPIANERRRFYLQLDEHAKARFWDMVANRINELVDARGGQADPQLSLQARPERRVMLYHLLEAMENIHIPPLSLLQNEAQYDACVGSFRSLNNNIATRSSSAPSLGPQSEPTG